MRRHKFQQLLSGYLDNELEPDLKKEVEEHLKTCEACRQELTALKDLDQAAQAWTVTMPGAAYWGGLTRSTLARIKEWHFKEVTLRPRVNWQRLIPITAAAAAAILVGVVGFQMIHSRFRITEKTTSFERLAETYRPEAPAEPVRVAKNEEKEQPAGQGRGVGGVGGGVSVTQKPVTVPLSFAQGRTGAGGAADLKAGSGEGVLASAPISQPRRKDEVSGGGRAEVQAAEVDTSIVPLDQVDVKPILKSEAPVAQEEYASKLAKGTALTVIVRALIDLDGSVSRIEVLRSSESDDIDQAAVQKIKQSIFSPALKNGKPVRVWMTMPVEFRK